MPNRLGHFNEIKITDPVLKGSAEVFYSQGLWKECWLLNILQSLALKQWQQENELGFSFLLETGNGLVQLGKMLQEQKNLP